LDVLLIDPSLFTAPYDAALLHALNAAGARARLAARPDRRAGETGLDDSLVDRRFHRVSERLPAAVRTAAKAVEHAVDDLRLAARARADVFHFQWLPLPAADRWLVSALRRRAPVVVTVHDTEPFNGAPTSRLQALGFGAALAAADRLIVHTQGGAERLARRGLDASRIHVIPHGPLSVVGAAEARTVGDGRWRGVLFGKIRPYKGLDVLIEAAGRMTPQDRAGLHLIVAGEALLDLAPLRRRIETLGLQAVFDIRPHFHDEAQTAAVLAQADGFVFPYREIEASGVLHLTAPLGRWIIASDLGAFRTLVSRDMGERIPAGDADALAAALTRAVRGRPSPAAAPALTGWDEIARRTLDVYRLAGAA
jgi:glycosyltransferase involved in cell wall biosynthesis